MQPHLPNRDALLALLTRLADFAGAGPLGGLCCCGDDPCGPNCPVQAAKAAVAACRAAGLAPRDRDMIIAALHEHGKAQRAAACAMRKQGGSPDELDGMADEIFVLALEVTERGLMWASGVRP